MSPSTSSKGKSSGLNQHYEEKVRPCIDLVDSLRSLGVEKDLNLPAIAVIGDQSSGKSSVLEALSGVALPRGTGIVTRCPLVLKLKKISKDNNWHQWHGLMSYRDQTKKLKDPAEIENAVLKAQTVLAGKGEGISHEMITLEIQSSDVPDLTLIDLPGIARVATGNQPKDIEKQIKDVIEKFIKRQETISLVVVPANIDIATTEALQMASKVDSTGQRTLGILTKPDLVDKGMEETVVRTVNNQVIQLKKGYMIVKCRGQQDINEKLDLVKALEKERHFFDEHAHFRSLLEEGKATIPLLAERLTKELVEHITKTLPQLQKQLEMKLEKTTEDLRALGAGVPTDEHEKNNFLITKIRQFIDALEGIKKAEEDLRSSDMRVFTKIRKEFDRWKTVLDAKTIKTEETLRDEVEEYVGTRRGRELPAFVNYRTFENIVKKHIEELEEPALKLLKDVTDIVHSCVNRIVSSHFKAFSHLLRATKDPIEDFLDEQFQKAEEKIHSQFKMERIVYSQDHLYSNKLDTVKQNLKVLGQRPFISAEVREMAQHLTAYFMITSDHLANQVPLIVQYHILDQYISQLQNAMLAMIGRNNPGMLLQEDSDVARKRRELKERLERLKSAGKVLSNDSEEGSGSSAHSSMSFSSLRTMFALRSLFRTAHFRYAAAAQFHASSNCSGAKVAVVLSGCGVYDGTEIHEASAILVHLSRGGAEVQMFAPDVSQMHVIDHGKGQPAETESRNVLSESARIARGNITDLAKLSASNHDAVIFPGGFGAAKNLSTFAIDGKDCKVNKDVERVLKDFHKAGKPIGLCCISPVLAARVLPGVDVTVGHEEEEGGKWPYAGTTQAITALGAKHTVKEVTISYLYRVFSSSLFSKL
ncbi:interferon-induced GTP-binding protein Mx isoform X3 [Ctenopharyngodon idella]|uniref:interferon-induced GTP-binding protein Mx isoform X3 n=1 Tax=Ctenopharyngodon idella TaxID=7959 RepID=UPI00222F2E94|nr:interferon-induced GTP-binding protein Mx isoform X3 [Ctenopharyngodon idella]